MPDLIRHPETFEKIGFRLEFIPMKIGAGMTKRNNFFLNRLSGKSRSPVQWFEVDL